MLCKKNKITTYTKIEIGQSLLLESSFAFSFNGIYVTGKSDFPGKRLSLRLSIRLSLSLRLSLRLCLRLSLSLNLRLSLRLSLSLRNIIILVTFLFILVTF
jgi:hypothetical protein